MKQTFTTLFRSIWILLIVSGCGTNKKVMNKPLSVYNNNFDVAYKLFHYENDISKLYIKAHSERFRLTVRGFENAKSKTPIFQESVQKEGYLDDLFEMEIPLKVPVYVLEMILTNLDNNEVWHEAVWVDKLQDNEQTIHIFDDKKNPLFEKYVPNKQLIYLSSSDPEITKFYIKYIRQNFKPAAPPYLQNSLKFDVTRRPKGIKTVNRDEPFVFHKEGLYVIQTDTLSEKGIFISQFQSDFPRITDAKELIYTTRYITKNKEYTSMNKTRAKKEALDAFWLSRGGTEERSKALISIYYNRVQQSNAYFTTYKEGWKTDRGIIYTIFGPPEKVQKTGDYEYWYYHGIENRPPTEFFFEKEDNQWLLRRSPYMEFAWQEQILKWRKGVVR